MRMLSRPALAFGATLLVGLASAPLLPGPAVAATIGTLSFTPATGTNFSLINAESATACTGGTNLYIKLTGPGFPAATGTSSGGYSVSGNAAQRTFPTNPSTGGYIVALQNHFQNFADSQTPPVTLGGTYTLTMWCQNNFGTQQFGEYVGRINFSSPTAYAVLAPVGNATATTTTLTTSATSAVGGTGVTFTAAVSPLAAAGSVQFKDGSANLGSPIAVTSGSAALTTTTLAIGSHSVTADFLPTDTAAYTTSTSAAATVSITAPTPVATTTTLTAAPTSPSTAGTSVILTATMSPATSVGQVQFKNGATSLGSAAVASGSATLTTTVLPVGSNSLTAIFTPTAGAAYLTSTSSALSYSVTGASSSAAASSSTSSSAASTSTSASPSTSPAASVLPTSASPTPAVTPSPTPAFTPSMTPAVTPSPSPSPSASPTSPFKITDAAGKLVSSTSGVVVGQKLNVVVTGFAAGEPVSVTVHSTPHALVATKADAKGVVSYAFTVPDDVSLGEHTLEFAAPTKTSAWQFLVVARPAVLGETLVSPSPSTNTFGTATGGGLPSTGAEIGAMVLFGLLLLTAGAMALSYARRRGFFTFGTD